MMENIAKFCLIFSCIFGMGKTQAAESQTFSLLRQDTTILEGYFLPADTLSSPIVVAIQGSSRESAFQWHINLCSQLDSLGLGLIVLEKQGVSKTDLNLFEYNQTNCLQKRLEDYILCLENMRRIAPNWKGKIIFWGESEGGMLAANLAGQIQETAAVLLFATGGGMKPREEIKWAIRHRLEERGALQDEVEQYMGFLNEQMDAMILDPSSDKDFLGNTYKWWASLLAADEVSIPLKQRCLPIFLIHGVKDNQIPILSADLAAEALKESNALTYLRLEGFGHDLDNINIQTAACEWLESILSGQEQTNSNIIASPTQSETQALENWKTDISHYVLTRGRGEGRGEGNEESRGGVHGSVKGARDSNGNERVSGDVGASYESDNGWKVEVNVGGSGNRDRNGNTKGEVHAEVRGSRDF